jgi:Skp family chaperone for outer membrane proteins
MKRLKSTALALALLLVTVSGFADNEQLLADNEPAAIITVVQEGQNVHAANQSAVVPTELLLRINSIAESLEGGEVSSRRKELNDLIKNIEGAKASLEAAKSSLENEREQVKQDRESFQKKVTAEADKRKDAEERAEISRLEIGKRYVLKRLVTGLIAADGFSCNYYTDKNSGCVALAGSEFIVESVSDINKDVFIRITRVSELKMPDVMRASRSGTGYGTLVQSGLSYSGDGFSLASGSTVYRPAIAADVKAILVPQKIYRSSYVHSADPTVGVALTLKPRWLKERYDLDLSLDYGVGINQLSVMSAGSVKEKMGGSIFAGYDLIGVSGIRMGIYIGTDYVSLDAGESFAGSISNRQRWIGLVLGTNLSKNGK